MKTAQEWLDNFPAYLEGDSYGELLPDLDYIAQIQLDAYKAGMQRALQIAIECKETYLSLGGSKLGREAFAASEVADNISEQESLTQLLCQLS